MDENNIRRSARRLLLNKKNRGRDWESIPAAAAAAAVTIDRLEDYQRSMYCCSYNFGFSSWLHRRRILTKALCRMTMVIILSTGLINLIFMLDATGYNKLKYTSDGPLTTQQQQQQQQQQSSSPPPLQPQRFITVEILSSRERADISVEGATIMEERGGGRGIHVVVLHQSTGAVLARRQFDTYSPHEDESMSLFLNLVRKGRIIIMAVKDEASYELKKPARMLLKQKFGSDYIGQLDWRDMWVHVVQKGRSNSLCEQLSRNPDLQNWAPPLAVTCLVPLTPELEDSQCQWSSSNEDERRREFCNQVEGYGSVCDCQEPAPITFQTAPIVDNQIRDVPVVVIAASTRPHYLYRMLRTLLSTKGADSSMVTVFIDGFAIEPMQIARLFGLRAVQHMPVGLKAVARITQHYKSALAAIFRLYPTAKRAILIEEDLDVSPDFFQYFSQLAPLLDEDKTLFCISAWNDYSYQHASANASLIYRVETMPGLGWMINAQLFKEELEPIWPTPDKNWDWDMWMRGYTMKGRECLIPDVSRTYHFGVKGIHMDPSTHDSYFKKRAFNNIPDVKLNDIHKLKAAEYEKAVEDAIRNAYVLNHKMSPCNESFIPDVTGKSYVVFMKMSSPHDRTAWVRIAKCFGIWDQDGRADHKGLWRLHLKTNPVFVVGVPYSPYSKFKPPELVPLLMNETVTKRRTRKH